MKYTIGMMLALVVVACKKNNLPEIKAKVITEQTVNDTDDPAIWVNKANPEASIVFGTDKESNGAIYAFDLDGKIIEEKTIKNMQRPNNVDLVYGFPLTDSTSTDIIVFTEREKMQIRMFSVPDMTPLDNGGFPVFTDATGEEQLPMGVALYQNPKTKAVSAIVGRKTGPAKNYLYQYGFSVDSLGTVKAELLRKFGAFSGKKEIEAIAVDPEMGFVYYSDEQHAIRKYHADPTKGDAEISSFGGDKFQEDIEGIAIARYGEKGYIIVSNQQKHSFVIFDRLTNAYVNEVNLGTIETDGCDVTTEALGAKFPNGLMVSMNDNKNFYYHDLGEVLKNN